MRRNFKLERLQAGESFTTSEKGNSMTPLIHSGQEHVLTPIKSLDEIQVDDIVYAKVKGNFYTHLVKAKHPDKGCLIGNNHGNINGWTTQVFAKVTQVL